jgi:Tfp pilus assembly protein PilP
LSWSLSWQAIMKAKISLLAFFVLASGILLHSGLSQKSEATESQEKQEKGSLIRKDLLVLQDKKFPSPQRNIFVRQRARTQQNETSPATSGNFQTSNPGASSSQEETLSKDVAVNLNYIGYVKSGDRVVALILLEGEAYAVESGDVLVIGVTIGEITPDDIEIIGSDSVSRRIKLEGE